MKKLKNLILPFLFAACAAWTAVATPGAGTLPDRQQQRTPVRPSVTVTVVRDGEYTSKQEVAQFIKQFGCLPKNYITKSQARSLGWQGGPLEPYAPGKSIGGDRYGNYERKLPPGQYRECDIDTRGKPRGTKRIVFSSARKVYYTENHYRSFEEVK